MFCTIHTEQAKRFLMTRFNYNTLRFSGASRCTFVESIKLHCFICYSGIWYYFHIALFPAADLFKNKEDLANI